MFWSLRDLRTLLLLRLVRSNNVLVPEGPLNVAVSQAIRNDNVLVPEGPLNVVVS